MEKDEVEEILKKEKLSSENILKLINNLEQKIIDNNSNYDELILIYKEAEELFMSIKNYPELLNEYYYRLSNIILYSYNAKNSRELNEKVKKIH